MVLDTSQLFSIYNWSTVTLSGFLIGGYAFSLHVIRKNSDVPFVSQLIILMIISNVGAILMVWSNTIVTKQDPPSYVYYFVVLQALAGLMRDGCFNVAHWQFAY